MGEDQQDVRAQESRTVGSSRLKRLIAGLTRLFGEEQTLHMLSNALTAEEIATSASRHTLKEIDEAIADAEAAGAARWAWVAIRLQEGRRTTDKLGKPKMSGHAKDEK